MIPTTRVDLLPADLPEDVTVLDVREPEEWAAGHVEGALHIPLGLLPERVHEVPEGRVLVVCKVGGRSAQAAMWLGQQGHETVNLDGGMLEWAAAGRPMVSETDAEPTVI